MRGRLLVGNLGAEAELARAFGEGRLPPAPRPTALATASALATLLRAFAAEGDRLWTPVPVDPARVPEVPGLGRPELVSGPLGALAPAVEVLAWMETPAVAELRRGGGREGGSPAPEIVARVAHRGFALEVARELGLALPGARWVSGLGELEEHLAAGGAAAGAAGAWVVKAPLSAAGRHRYIHEVGEEPLSPAAGSRLERLFAAHGPLLFEPWMERTEDFGVAALLSADGFQVVGFHRLLVDRGGGFVGIELTAGFPGLDGALAGFSEGEREGWRRALERVAAALSRAGYRGPFGLDGWRYRSGPAEVALNPLGEINPRWTFGRVARALADRVGAALGWEPGARVRLAVGRRAPGPGAVELLTPGEDGSPGAWLGLGWGARSP